MSRPALADLLLLAVAAVSAATAIARNRGGEVVATAFAEQAAVVAGTPPSSASHSWGRARSPFRLSSEAPALRYGEVPPPPVAPTVRPESPTYTFELKAVVGGPPWLAVVSGLPGVAGDQVVREGDQFRDLMIERIAQDEVHISGPDTAWTLALPTRRR